MALTREDTSSRGLCHIKFVEGWDYVQTLGEGAYGDVGLLVYEPTGESVACKMIDLASVPSIVDVKKEVLILKRLSHPHVMRYHGHREENGMMYIFLEYCSGGELFDRIEPDLGMPKSEAQRYTKELLGGLSYIHGLGIVHRDLKPENLLLDDKDSLRISDFGLATMYRNAKGVTRALEKRCGTFAYVAPEVLQASPATPYQGVPADIWSVGVILIAMLCGELPWAQPTDSDLGYAAWKEKNIRIQPWLRVDTALLRKILNTSSADKRASIDEILADRWMVKRFAPEDDGPYCDSFADRCTENGITHYRLASSQPLNRRNSSTPLDILTAAAGQHSLAPIPVQEADVDSFSQPARTEDVLLGTFSGATTMNSQDEPVDRTKFIERMVRRMTRLLVARPRHDAVVLVCRACEALGCTWNLSNNGVVTVKTYNDGVTFKLSFYEMGSTGVLCDCRLSKGDGLDFKRVFRRMRERLKSSLAPATSCMDWSNCRSN